MRAKLIVKRTISAIFWPVWLRLRYGKNTRIALSARVSQSAVIRAQHGGSIEIGAGCEIEEFALIKSYGGSIEIGEGCFIGPSCILYGHGGLQVGRYVKMAGQCVVIPSNHRFDNIEQPIFMQGENSRGVVIEDDVWLGAGVKVLDGVTIGHGSVVGAGAVVTRNTEPYGVYVGVPAIKIRSRLDQEKCESPNM